MKRSIFAMAAATSLVASGAAAQDLWRGVQANDTVAEVLERLPGAVERDGFVTVANLKIANKDWTARLSFDDAGLNYVALKPDQSVDPAIYIVLFNPVLTDLREAYGEPFSCDRNSLGQHCEWRQDNKVIRLGYMEVGDIYDLTISYTPRTEPRPPL